MKGKLGKMKLDLSLLTVLLVVVVLVLTIVLVYKQSEGFQGNKTEQELQTDITNAKSAVANAQQAFDAENLSYKETSDRVSGELETKNSSLTGLKQDLELANKNNNQALVANLENQINALNIEIDGLNKELDDALGSLTNAQKALTQAYENLTQAENALTEFQKQQQGQQGQQGGQQGQNKCNMPISQATINDVMACVGSASGGAGQGQGQGQGGAGQGQGQGQGQGGASGTQ